MKSNWIAQGPQVEQIEERFREMFGGGKACSVSNGSSALYLALKALGADKNAHVILPTYACSALLNAIHLIGAKPILVDVDEDTFCLDGNLVKRFSKKAKYVIAVHTFGSIVDIEPLRSDKNYIIEDCCQSLGADQLQSSLGKYSHAAVFSFYATKLLTGGQGGLVWSKDESVISNIMDYRQFDCRESYKPRFNFQITDINAALINSQLKRLEDNCNRRKKIAKEYTNHLHSSLTLQKGTCDKGGVPYRYVVKAPDINTREKLSKHMDEHNIECTIPIQRFELLHQYLNLDPKSFPMAEKIVDTTLSLPIHAGLSDSDINYITEKLKCFKP